jgi:membrane protease YdiL (CAAX protease family)
MNKRVKVGLLGLMIWLITFIAGFFIFVIFDIEADGPLTDLLWINGIDTFFLAIGLALALFLLYRDKGQDYKRTAWEAGIAWYVIILLMDLIVLVGLFGLESELLFPSILSDSTVLIIPIVVGYLLAGPKEKV